LAPTGLIAFELVVTDSLTEEATTVKMKAGVWRAHIKSSESDVARSPNSSNPAEGRFIFTNLNLKRCAVVFPHRL
jgi:hypothetical protein